MRPVLFVLVLCITCLAEPMVDVEVVVPPSAAHPQDWLHPQIRENPKPDYLGKSAGSLAEFVEPEVISRIVVDQYAGPADDVRRYLTAMPGAAAQNFGLSLKLCAPPPRVSGMPPAVGARLDWTSTSTVTFESGRSGRLAVASVIVSKTPLFRSKVFGLSDAPGCIGFDKVPVDSLYVSYLDLDGYSWAFAIPLQTKK